MDMRYKVAQIFFFPLLLITLGGCKAVAPISPPEGERTMTIKISSPAVEEGGLIPRRFTCDGEDLSLPLAWSGMPPEAKSLALIVDDPDAPVGIWVHWILYDMSPTLTSLPEGVVKTPSVSGIGIQGTNDFHKIGYGGPCPPKGKPHRYFFKLYALDSLLNLQPGVTKAALEKAMQGHILAQGQWFGVYRR